MKNNFEDNGKAIVNIYCNEVFYYSFSSDAHIINKNIDNYRYATEQEEELLTKYFQYKKENEPKFLKINL